MSMVGDGEIDPGDVKPGERGDQKVAWQGVAVNGWHSWSSYAHGAIPLEKCVAWGLENATMIHDLDPSDFPPELVIVGTNFSGEISKDERAKFPEGRPVFPDGVRGLLFVNCNLDNVLLPPDSKLCENSCHQQHEAFEEPLLDEKGNPVLDEREQPVMTSRDYAVTVTVDALDKEKVTVEPVAVMGSAEAVADWDRKREPPLTKEELPVAEAAEVKP
jgi:hypothetical protein